MKKNGFTLIELLAVIVILAVIALISVPLVLNQIEISRKGAFKQTASNIVRAAETYAVSESMNGTAFNGETFSFPNNISKLKFKGNVPTGGTVEVNSDGKVTLISLTDGKYCANKSENNDEVVITKCGEEEDGAVVSNLGYQVTFKVNGENYYASSCKHGGIIGEPPKPTKENYTFVGWKDSNNNIVTFPYTPTQSTFLTAYFTNVHTVVNYIQSTNSQYIDLNYIPNENTKIVMTISNVTINQINNLIISAANKWTNSIFCFEYDTQGGFRWMASPSSTFFKKNMYNEKATIELYRNYVKYNDEVIKNDTTNWNYGNVLSLRVFKDPRIVDVNVGNTVFKLYGLTIYENNQVVKNFVPIHHNELNKAGLYETISGTYYFNLNENTSDFVYE